MSVYKPAKSRFFHYDFIQKGARFHGSTYVESRRVAEAVERKVRQDAALGLLDADAAMTLDLAAGRWCDEVGNGLASRVDRERSIRLLVKLIGPATLLTSITTARVSAAVERRRGMTFQRAAGKDAKRYRPSNSTVNRDIIDTLRPILRRARKTWEVKGLPEIDWAALRLPEPKPKVLEFSSAELESIVGVCLPHWADFIHFMARYGLRLGEMFFGLGDLDLDDRASARVTIRDRKGGDDKVLPLLPEDAAMLAARASRAAEAGLDTVWFRQKKPPKLSRRAPRLLALTYGGAGTLLRRAMTKTGLRASKGAKGAHGLRHHMGMKTLRATGNLRTTQRLMGHANVRSTMVYADAVEQDLRDALAAVSRYSPEPAPSPAEEQQVEQPLKRAASDDL